MCGVESRWTNQNCPLRDSHLPSRQKSDQVSILESIDPRTRGDKQEMYSDTKFNSRHEESKYVSMTWRATSAGPYPDHLLRRPRSRCPGTRARPRPPEPAPPAPAPSLALSRAPPPRRAPLVLACASGLCFRCTHRPLVSTGSQSSPAPTLTAPWCSGAS
jgi:hypothetical protein